jgi:integrase
MAWHRVEEGIFRLVNPAGGLYPTYYVRFSVRGRERFESAKTTSIKQARLYRASKQLATARGEPLAPGRITVTELLDDLERTYALNGKLTRTARAHLQLFRDALGHLHPTDCTADVVEELQRTWRATETVTAATINRRCNVLRRAFRWGQRKGKIAFVPYVGRLDESASPRGRYLPAPDARRLEAELAAWVRPVFAVGYDLGIRKGQLARTRREYVDLTPGRESITWPPAECKARIPHVVPLRGRVLALVRTAMRAAPAWPCPYLFHGPRCAAGRTPAAGYGCVGDFKTALANACGRAGLPYGRRVRGYTFHSTRHSAATNLRAGMDEADAMKVTGHKTAHVFRHYEHGQLDVLRARMDAAAAALGGEPDVPPAGQGRPPRASRGPRLRVVGGGGRRASGSGEGDKEAIRSGGCRVDERS